MAKYKRGLYPCSDREKAARIGTLLDSLNKPQITVIQEDNSVKNEGKNSRSGWLKRLITNK